MSKQKALDFGDFAREIVDVPVADEMSESFLAYSLSVITSRAIPDVRDGLKPVQRRILYSMLQMGIRPDTPHRKSARVVGDTMGRYHPHGDSAIYETLVRMGQDFSRMVTLVDPQGNFGGLDDPPAAARYTECRLTDAAMDMVREIDEDTVEFRPTYDGEGEEPVYLPALVPNLLVNGTTGIAVGMATSMPSHNLAEIAEAIELVMKKRRPKPTTAELMAAVPGPDFPSGGTIIGDDLAEITETGKGTFRIRARAEIEQITRSRQGIIVTELPYQVGPERVIGKVKELIRDNRIEGIAEVANLSDHINGLRIEIQCKPGINPQAVLGELYRLTPLEETFSVNNVVLVDGVPTTLGLYDLCRHYIDHRLDVIVRRTRFRLARAEARLHIVAGLLIALDNIDDVVTIIRRSKDTPQAKERLMEFLELSEIQATHILDMPLRRLTALERQKLIDERDELEARIADLNAILGSEKRRRTIVLTELAEIVDAYGRERRTEIVHSDDLPTFDVIDLVDDSVDDEPCIVSLSTSGNAGRVPAEGAKRAKNGRHDVLVSTAMTTTRAPVMAITSEGRALTVTAYELGDGEGRARGSGAAQAFGTNRGEAIHLLFVPGDEHLVLVTAQGIAKRLTATEVAETKSGKTLIKLKPGDSVAAAFTAPEGIDIAIVASDAQVLRTGIDAISIQGRGAGGVAGMKLKGDATVVGAGPIFGDDVVIIAATDGTAKATPVSELDAKGRGGGGVRLTKLTGATVALAHVGNLAGLLAVVATDDDDTKPDPNPVPVPLEPTKRDLTPSRPERPILALGPARW
ncbi:MAG: DNA topoisomerase IV subunit A [Acidimicrobiales bacterium]|nr:DNA topoisomerase IV subunit A [Acidimicrobiales bacterium]